ncbi:MAG: biotin synthase BioB [bacterium]
MKTENSQFIRNLGQRVLEGESLSLAEAGHLDEQVSWSDLPALFETSTRIREKFLGRDISLCAITNVKSGYCGEDCIFCAQSLHHQARISSYPLISVDQIIERAAQAKATGARCFSLVASGGRTENPKEIDRLAEAIQKMKVHVPSLDCAASLGTVSFPTLTTLKEAGLKRYHHNLETAEDFFPHICTTHSYQQRRDTIEAARAAGLKVCSGGIFGLGETSRQRLELAFTLRELEVDSLPINFLHPIAGTRCQGKDRLHPLEALKSIALLRFMLPQKSIMICGGRHVILRSLQSWIFLAGADGLMVGNYLTTKGMPWSEDRAMLQDLGFLSSVTSS